MDAQNIFLNSFENIINRRNDIPEDIRRFQKTLQYAKSKVDYAIGEFICMLPSDMNLRIGKAKNYNNKILILSSSFKIRTNLRINLGGEKDKPGVKSKKEEIVKTKPDIKSNKEHKQDVKVIRTKPNIKKEDKRDTETMKNEPDTHDEEKAALILGITSTLHYGGYSSDSFSSRFHHKICVYQNSNTCYKCPQILR